CGRGLVGTRDDPAVCPICVPAGSRAGDRSSRAYGSGGSSARRDGYYYQCYFLRRAQFKWRLYWLRGWDNYGRPSIAEWIQLQVLLPSANASIRNLHDAGCERPRDRAEHDRDDTSAYVRRAGKF